MFPCISTGLICVQFFPLRSDTKDEENKESEDLVSMDNSSDVPQQYQSKS
jgi:hypothetical protein